MIFIFPLLTLMRGSLNPARFKLLVEEMTDTSARADKLAPRLPAHAPP
jgi:hypothetical protein